MNNLLNIILDHTLLVVTLFVLVAIMMFLLYRSKKLNEHSRQLQSSIEDALKDLEKLYKQAKIGTWELNIQESILIWNDMTYKIFGEDKNTNPISTVENFLKKIHPDDAEKVQNAYNAHLENRQPYYVMHRLILNDNSVKYVEERCETTFNEKGEPLVSKGTIQDVTQQQLAILDIKKKDEQILHQSRLAQMGELLSMIAHQWRQPLSAISATTSNLRFKIMLEDMDKKTFENELSLVESYAQHLSKTIDDFRGFLHSDTVEKTTTLEKMVNQTISLVDKLLSNKKIVLEEVFTCNETVFTYESEVKQVILNLLKNAEDALLSNNIKNPKIRVKTLKKQQMMVIVVEDNAGGIPESLKNKIFDPYFSTKGKKNGTGLGLYMSKIIIEEHCQGKLYFKNSEFGTAFFIELKN